MPAGNLETQLSIVESHPKLPMNESMSNTKLAMSTKNKNTSVNQRGREITR